MNCLFVVIVCGLLCLCVVCRLVFVDRRCSLFVVCCMLLVVYCSLCLFVVRCLLLFVVWCLLLFVVCCLLFVVVCCLACVVWPLFVDYY